MIRIVLITAGFFSVTIALLVIQPGPDPRAPVLEADAPDVTRADSELTSFQATSHTVTTQPVDQDALGFGLSDILDPEPEAADATPEPAVSNILANLQPETPVATDAAPAAQTGVADNPLELLVIRALNQGQSEDYIDALVNHAAHEGTVEVPQSLVTSDGQVDTGALLSALRPQAMANTTGPGKGLYKVEPGDSLASIAYRFYGTTGAKDAIFHANRDRLSSPDHLQVGLDLILPAQ